MSDASDIMSFCYWVLSKAFSLLDVIKFGGQYPLWMIGFSLALFSVFLSFAVYSISRKSLPGFMFRSSYDPFESDLPPGLVSSLDSRLGSDESDDSDIDFLDYRNHDDSAYAEGDPALVSDINPGLYGAQVPVFDPFDLDSDVPLVHMNYSGHLSSDDDYQYTVEDMFSDSDVTSGSFDPDFDVVSIRKKRGRKPYRSLKL